MKSSVITNPNQLTLELEPGLAERYRSLRDCVATGVYQRGLKRIAIDLDMAPSNLSVQLSEDPSRHFSVDSLERYIEITGDMTPLEYLISRFYAPDKRDAAMQEVKRLHAQLQSAMQKAGIV